MSILGDWYYTQLSNGSATGATTAVTIGGAGLQQQQLYPYGQGGQIGISQQQIPNANGLAWWLSQQPKPIVAPDEFTAWIEEVKKQDRIEELVKALYAACVKPAE